MLYRASGLLLTTLLLDCASPSAPPSAGNESEPPDRSDERGVSESTSELDLRVEPFTDFYFLVRAQAAGVVAVDEELRPIIDAFMPVQEHIGTFGGFWPFDLAGMLSSSPEEFATWFEEQDETMPSRAGGEIPIRGPGLAMAEAMTTAWPLFLEQRWPDRRARLMDARRQLDESFMSRHREALHYMLESLNIVDPQLALPTYLALEIHPPGASTYHTDDGPVAVLAIEDLLGEGRFSDLEETLLHETSHALDFASRGDGDAFSRLRSMLEERGFERRDQAYHDVPHLIMFVQSEETMRRLYDPSHVAYGDTRRGDIAPLYERSGPIAQLVRLEWARYLDGEQSMDEALTSIADAAAAERRSHP